MEVDLSSGNDNGNSAKIDPPIPEFGDEQDIGTIFTVTPQIKKNNIIGLSISPEVTAYIGKDSEMVPVIIERWDPQSRQYIEDKTMSKTFEVWKPVISTRKLVLDVNVKNGETLVLGGLSDSQISTRLDKVPFFGDLPLIGRLFQSQSEMSTRKNMLIFVTARLVNDSGRPTNMLDNRTDIPDVNR